MTTSEYAQLQSKLDRIEGKMPDIKSGLSNVGSRLGGLVGMPEFGKKAGAGISKLLGFGDYSVASNSLVKNVGGETIVPKFDNKGNNGIRVREREFLGDVVSGAANTFKNTVYPITPTNSVTFPWLSQVAKLFDQWEPNGVVFEFVTTSSDFNGSAQGLGSVIMATDYDVLDASYANKRVMDNADYANSGKPSITQLHGIECDPNQRPYRIMYTQSIDALPANRNTLGNFQLATAGVSANTVTLGELWVSYDITLYKKQVDPAVAPFSTIIGTNTVTTWGTFTVPQNFSGFTWALNPANLLLLDLTFPAGIVSGRFLISRWYQHDAGADPTSNIVVVSGGTLQQLRYGIPNASPWGTTSVAEWVFDVTGASAHLYFISQNTTVTDYAISVTQVPLTYTI